MILCCWLDALLGASHVSVSEWSRLGVVREARSPLPVPGPSCGRAVSLRAAAAVTPRPWACPSQCCPHPKASCGRNLKAQPLGPSPALPSSSLPCSPVLRGCTLAPGPQALQTFSPGEVWGPVGCTHTALMGTRQVSHPGLGSLQAYSSSEPQPQACWWRPPSPSLSSREPLLSQHLTT